MAKVNDKTIELIKNEASLLADPLGLKVVKVEYLKEDGLWYLRVTISAPSPITTDDCARLHRPLSKCLDELDPIPGSYYLEVTSSGSEESVTPQ